MVIRNVKYCFFFALLLVFSLGYSQSEKKLLKEGDDYYTAGEKERALTQYLKAYEKNPENPVTNFKIGKTYLETLYKPRSLKYLEKAYAANPKVDKDIFKYLGLSYHYNHQFEKAIDYYTKYQKQLPPDHPDHKKITRKIEECHNGIEYVSHPIDAKIENIGGVINTPYPEFAPVISADESVLIFTSRREGSTGGEIDEQGMYYEDIYISEKVNGKWGPPQNIGANINTPTHDATVGLSADGKELFIYKDDGNGDIFYCKLKKDGGWSKPLPFDPINSKRNYENSAAISADEKRVFFTSDREGGFGGLDIWMIIQDNAGNWSKPINLGPEVNTAEDEEGPFLDLDEKTLYFSSKAHKGMGDYDIYRSVYDEKTGKWSSPENMGYPVNTADNDIYFVLSGDGRHGYFASIKEDGYGEKDIYMITLPKREDYKLLVNKMEKVLEKTIVIEEDTVIAEVKPEPVKVEEKKEITNTVSNIQLQPVILKGTIQETPSGSPLLATVQLFDESGKLLKEILTGSDGSYHFETTYDKASKCTITAKKDGFGFTSKSVSVPARTTETKEIVTDLTLGKIEVGQKFILRNIYFDFDKATIKPESKQELNKLLAFLKDNPTVSVEIAGHTDNYGSNSYNLVLSQKRAESVVQFLVNNGVDRNRLQAKGYGEEKPLATNDDEEEGREINRRTEFEILGK